MKIIKTSRELIKFRESHQNIQVGLVPTMGNLHEGHMELVRASICDNQITIISIFVNPTQFGENEDFEQYPRTLEDDIYKISQCKLEQDRQIIIFVPKDIEEIFPQNFATNIIVDVSFTQILCGQSRPTHFDGVTSVVYLLFKITQPHTAYFGEKDYQQLFLIKKMTQDLMLPVNIKSIPTQRDEHGRARSSRNNYILPEEFDDSLVLTNTLERLMLQIQHQGYDANAIELEIKQLLKNSTNWDYLEVRNADDLSKSWENASSILIAGAYKLSKARLIDNRILERTVEL